MLIKELAVSTANDTSSKGFEARMEKLAAKWEVKREKRKQAGWEHSMCLKCF